MTNPIHVPRLQGGRTVTHQTPDYRVFAVKVVNQWPVFGGQGGDEGRVYRALNDQLVSLLSRVASSSAAATPIHIDLQWLDTIPELIAAAPRPRDLIIFFQRQFDGGLIQQYCSAMSGRSGAQHYMDVVTINHTTQRGICGYTFVEHERPPRAPNATADPPEMHWYCVEVYTARVWDSVPYHGGIPQHDVTTNGPAVDAAIGVALANVAFHEAMHAKVEPMKQRAAGHLWDSAQWDMHDRLDGVARPAHYLDATDVTQTNLDDLKRGLLNNAPTMVARVPALGTTTLPLPASPAQPRTAAPANLDGLDSPVDLGSD